MWNKIISALKNWWSKPENKKKATDAAKNGIDSILDKINKRNETK